VDLVKLKELLEATQSEVAAELKLDNNSPTRRAFLSQLEKEVAARGVVDVLRHGVKHQKHSIDLFYGTPSPGNVTPVAKYSENRLSVTRQLHFSLDESKLSLDLAIFINGLPIATVELKNSLTKQNIDHAIRQDCNDRDPRERLFGFGRCIVHCAVDDSQVMMCTHLEGKKSWFLPFNKGHNDGAGNPPNPGSLKTDYLWKLILTPTSHLLKMVMTDVDSELITMLEVLPANGAEARSAVALVRHVEQVHGNDVETLSIDGIGFKGAVLRELTDPEDLAIEVIVPPTDFQKSEGFLSTEFQLTEDGTRVTCPGRTDLQQRLHQFEAEQPADDKRNMCAMKQNRLTSV
jgi:hypothetical protein